MALHQAVQGVPEALRETSPPAGGWSVAQIVQHLVLTDRRFAQLLARVAAQLKDHGGDHYDVDAFLQSRKLQAVLDRSFKVEAWEAIRPTEDWDTRYAWQQLEETRARLIEQIRSTTGMPLGTARHPHRILGELNLYEWIAFLGTHEARHAQQIRELAEMLADQPTD